MAQDRALERVMDRSDRPSGGSPVTWVDTAGASAARRALTGVVACAVIAPRRFAMAQSTKKMQRMGVLLHVGDRLQARISEPLAAELTRLGLVEGVNLVIDLRWADDPSRLATAAAELVALKPDVIVTGGGRFSAMAAKMATSTIPIVFADVGNPVSAGLVASLAQPGGNLTGTAVMSRPLNMKRLEILAEVMGPGATIAILDAQMQDESRADYLAGMETAAAGRGDRIQLFEVGTAEDLAPAFERMARQRINAVAIGHSSLPGNNVDRIAALVAKYRLPAIASGFRFARAGIMLTYTIDFQETEQRTARYVHKILTGAKPADLPVEQASRFKFIVNLKTAKLLGVKVPQSVLLRADEAIE